MKPWLAGLSALTIAVGMASPALAADAAQSTPGMEKAAPAAAQISDAELKTFAVAALKVREIGTEWRPKIAEAGSEAEATEFKAEARDEMIEAVEGEGLTVDRYQEIIQQVRTDPDLAQKVTAHMRETQ